MSLLLNIEEIAELTAESGEAVGAWLNCASRQGQAEAPVVAAPVDLGEPGAACKRHVRELKRHRLP